MLNIMNLRVLVITTLLVFAIFMIYVSLTGGWRVTHSGIQSSQGAFLQLTRQEQLISVKMKQYVNYLAGTLGQRNSLNIRNYQAAADYIEHTFRKNGLKVYVQEFTADHTRLKNIIAEIKGTTNPGEVIIFGAHYDSVYGSPGADDNASGVAALLTISELISKKPLKRTVRLVAFANEEPPAFYTSQMGSWQYAKMLYSQHENVIAMFSIESIGYYSEESNSQSYPLFLGLFYPDKGNFIGFAGNLDSSELVSLAVSSFSKHVNFPSEGISAPSLIPGISWSDHRSFWKHGYKAVMVTDTVPYRNPHYHQSSDTPDTLDYDRMARATSGLTLILLDLANPPDETHLK